MIGQVNLFAPEAEAPLRSRVQVDLVPASVARHVLETYHYLHRARVGSQIHYSVSVDGVTDGVISYAYPMMTADLCGVPCRQILEFARMYLHRNIPHVASCAIGKTGRRYASAWAHANPQQPPARLVVSWSDTVYHVGTIYKAANFAWVRRSSPGGRQGDRAQRKAGVHGKVYTRPDHDDYKHDKDCWIYWLDAKEREQNRKA